MPEREPGINRDIGVGQHLFRMARKDELNRFQDRTGAVLCIGGAVGDGHRAASSSVRSSVASAKWVSSGVRPASLPKLAASRVTFWPNPRAALPPAFAATALLSV